MNVLHITPITKGYEEAELIANHVNKENHLAVIKVDGKLLMTGGFIIEDTAKIRKVLDSIPKEELYDFLMSIKMTPYVKEYMED